MVDQCASKKLGYRNGFFFGLKQPKVERLIANTEINSPFLSPFMVVHPFCFSVAVSGVTRFINKPKIPAGIVQAISILVIGNESVRRKTKNISMHSDMLSDFPLTFTACRITPP